MKWQFPWVSRRYAEILDEQLQRAIKERDAHLERADRMADQLLNRVGFEPVSAPVRHEMQEMMKEIEAYTDASQFEDAGTGMLSEEFTSLVDDKPAN